MDRNTTAGRFADRETVFDSLVMRSDPGLPVYLGAMERIEHLMLADTAPGTPEGDELNVLVDVAMFYERRWFPEFICQAVEEGSSQMSDMIHIGELSREAYAAIEDYSAEKDWHDVRKWMDPATLLLLIERLKRTEDSPKLFPKGKSATIQQLQMMFDRQFTLD